MFEKKDQEVAPMSVFLLRMLYGILIAIGVLTIAAGVGVCGFHLLENMSWLDSFENSAMILSTMGPVIPITSQAGKVFASLYALFSGLIFVTMAGVILAPVAHRLLHKFHSNHRSL